MGSKPEDQVVQFKPFTESDSGNKTLDMATTDPVCSGDHPESSRAQHHQPSLDNSDASDKENSLDSSSLLDSSFKSRSSIADAKSAIRLQVEMNAVTKLMTENDESFNLVPLEEETPLFVTCGPNQAVLYLERLDKGSKGASILFENWWLTPNEFQKISGRGTAKDWKRSIKHHGRSLKLLMAKTMLFLNPPLCKCEYCVSDAEAGDNGIKKEGEEGNLPKQMTSAVEVETGNATAAVLHVSTKTQDIHTCPDPRQDVNITGADTTQAGPTSPTQSVPVPHGEAHSATVNNSPQSESQASQNSRESQLMSAGDRMSSLNYQQKTELEEQTAAFCASSHKIADDFLQQKQNGAGGNHQARPTGGSGVKDCTKAINNDDNGASAALEPNSLTTGSTHHPPAKGSRHQQKVDGIKTTQVKTTKPEPLLPKAVSMVADKFLDRDAAGENDGVNSGVVMGDNMSNKLNNGEIIDGETYSRSPQSTRVAGEVKTGEINIQQDLPGMGLSNTTGALAEATATSLAAPAHVNKEEVRPVGGEVGGMGGGPYAAGADVNLTTDAHTATPTQNSPLGELKGGRESNARTEIPSSLQPQIHSVTSGRGEGENGWDKTTENQSAAEGYIITSVANGACTQSTGAHHVVCGSPPTLAPIKTAPSESPAECSLSPCPPHALSPSPAVVCSPADAPQTRFPARKAPTNPSLANPRANEEDIPTTAQEVTPGGDQESQTMSPKKEARLINIIEELKHYKKCLEVQIQEQKKTTTSPSNMTKLPPSPTTTTPQPQCTSTATSSSLSTSASCVTLPSVAPMVIPTPNVSRMGMLPIPFSADLTSTTSANRLCLPSAVRSGRVGSPGSKEATVSDPTSHATGTVHWGMPKGHSPSHSSHSSSVIMSTHRDTKVVGKSGHSMGRNRTPPQGSMKHGQNGLKANGIYSASKDFTKNQSLKKTARAGNTNVSSSLYKSLAANINNNNNTSIPGVDMNAYFSYLSECLKRGQMPNMYGYYNGVPPTGKTGDNSPMVASETRSRTSPSVSHKRSLSHEPRFDEAGALDLSTKRPRLNEESVGYTRQSSQPVTVDEFGALDLSKK